MQTINDEESLMITSTESRKLPLSLRLVLPNDGIACGAHILSHRIS